MKAETREVAKIFGPEVRYVVPLYQRPYVWNADQHWRPLWEDVKWTFDHQLLAPGKVAPHFLGAIVVEQQPTPVGEVDVRLIIDGQQRLTTLQLLIAAISHVAVENGQDGHAAALRKLIRNDDYYVKHPDESFKVWPTNVNRDAYRIVMALGGGQADAEDDDKNRIQEAFTFFVNTLRPWATSDENLNLERRFAVLTGVVRQLVKIVVIDLEPEDNAQVIFESLNARGTPLLAVDLVKNVLFQRAATTDAEAELLYETYWKPFDSSFWQQRIKQGRLQRARSEIFLMHWLTMTRASESKADQLYIDFKVLLDSPDAPPPSVLLERFARERDLFADFSAKAPGTFEARFFHRLNEIDTSTALPLVLELYRRDAPFEELYSTMRILESWLIRRAVGRLTAAAYNRLFVDLLVDIRESSDPADEVVHRQLASAFEADSSRWPADDEFKAWLVETPLYERLTQRRVVMLLAQLERDLRGPKVEDIELPAKLSIEHVLPQSWEAHWPLPHGEDPEQSRLRRLASVHRLGNLTLVSGKLNPSLSNSGWAAKRQGLVDNSVLLLNSRLVNDHETWNEETIDRRSNELATRLLRIFPGPHTPVAYFRSLGNTA